MAVMYLRGWPVSPSASQPRESAPQEPRRYPNFKDCTEYPEMVELARRLARDERIQSLPEWLARAALGTLSAPGAAAMDAEIASMQQSRTFAARTL
jgi:hypothetical protein